MRHKDSRARLTGCILRNMRTVKCHGWEGAFLDRVLRVRGRELGALRTSGLLFSVSLVSFQVSTFLVTSPWSPCRARACLGAGGGRQNPRILEPLFVDHPVHPNAPLRGPALSQGSPLSAELANRSGHSREHGSGPREVFRSGRWAQEAAEVGPQAHPAAAPRWAQRPSCLPLSDFTNSRRISLLKRGFVATPLQTNLRRLTAASTIKPKLVIKRSNW